MAPSITPIYTPLLKAKQAEFAALGETTEQVKDRLIPIIEVPPAPRDREAPQERKAIAEHLTPIAPKIEKAWGLDRPVMVDLPYVDAGALLADGTHPSTLVFNAAAESGVLLIPVVGLARDRTYETAAAAAAVSTKQGIAVRLVDHDLANMKALDYQLRTLLARLGASRESTDVIIDAKQITTNEVATRAAGLRVILSTFPARSAWRSFTVLSGAFPSSLADLRGNTLRRIRRSDWELWRTITAEMERPIRFGDYAIDNPTPFDPENPKAMQVSASIRYTSADVWVVVKGKSTKKEGWEQTSTLCQVLLDRPEYMGEAYSAGDAYIANRARGKVKCGNPTTWRRVGVTHHLTIATDQLAMYGAP